jgi:hypothetical protein
MAFDVGRTDASDAGAASAPGTRWQLAVAVALTLLVLFPQLYAYPAPMAAVVGAAPLALVLAVRQPFAACLVFIAFSFFRLHEAYPILGELHIPLLLAIVTLTGLAWNWLIARSIEPYLSRELALFCVFFMIGTAGLVFAYNRTVAWTFWSETYWKIGIMTLAIAWLANRREHFRLAAWVLVVSGCLVALVVVYNKFNGIGLVEGTRVTVGRDIKSVLGDPNDLTLVLLFPFGFACALLLHRGGPASTLMALIAVPLILVAIIFTQSRGGLVGVVTILTVLGLRVVRSRLLVLLAGGLAALVLFAAMGLATRGYFAVAGGGGGIDLAAYERLYTWRAAIWMMLARPLTGVGLNNFTNTYYLFTEFWIGKAMAPHSTWLGVLAETGIPGFAVFVAMVAFCFRSILRALSELAARDPVPEVQAISVALLASLAGFCVSGAFLTQGFNWPIYVMIALTAAVGRYVRTQAGRQRPA